MGAPDRLNFFFEIIKSLPEKMTNNEANLTGQLCDVVAFIFAYFIDLE